MTERKKQTNKQTKRKEESFTPRLSLLDSYLESFLVSKSCLVFRGRGKTKRGNHYSSVAGSGSTGGHWSVHLLFLDPTDTRPRVLGLLKKVVCKLVEFFFFFLMWNMTVFCTVREILFYLSLFLSVCLSVFIYLYSIPIYPPIYIFIFNLCLSIYVHLSSAYLSTNLLSISLPFLENQNNRWTN